MWIQCQNERFPVDLSNDRRSHHPLATSERFGLSYAFHDFTDSETVELELDGTVSLAFDYRWLTCCII